MDGGDSIEGGAAAATDAAPLPCRHRSRQESKCVAHGRACGRVTELCGQAGKGGRTDKRMDRQMDRWMNGWTDGWTVRGTDEQADRQTD